MPNSFLSLDVETANSDQASICQIGAVTFEGGEIVGRWQTLVNPEDHFDGGPNGPYQANLDHWYVKFASGGFDVWIGRNELSYLHQDDLFIFDNVTYAGAGGSYRQKVGPGTLIWNLNHVTLPVGMRDISGTGLIGQLAYDRDFEKSGFTTGSGLISRTTRRTMTMRRPTASATFTGTTSTDTLSSSNGEAERKPAIGDWVTTMPTKRR